jgi:hypothetical protein
MIPPTGSAVAQFSPFESAMQKINTVSSASKAPAADYTDSRSANARASVVARSVSSTRLVEI